jgi:hypothetical protein
MARQESDREDLMAEATALRERVEFEVPGEAEQVVAGFRGDGRWSIYFGSDPVYHFDANGGLRRAFVAGDLYRSQARTLARLTRMRTPSAVQLVRHDLDPGELDRFLTEMTEHLDRLYAALEQNTVRVIQRVPPGLDLIPRLARAVDVARPGRLSSAIKKRP